MNEIMKIVIDIKNNNKENIKKYELLNIAILLKLC